MRDAIRQTLIHQDNSRQQSNWGAQMKSKKTPAADGKGAQTGMDGVDGADGADGAAAMSGNGEAGQASLQLKSEIMAGIADPNDRGMPGVTRRGQQQA
jgi:hypothetical protein